MNDISKSVRHIMTVFLICFVGMIGYIAYFQVFKAPEIASDSGNVRLWAKRNEVLRGTIYDRDGNALTSSEKIDAISQKREYLYGELYAHALGYVDPAYGLTGLEASFDEELTKSNNLATDIRSLFKDFDIDKFIQARKDSEREKVGNSVITTLDTELQQIAYDALGSNRGAVVALNPKTGEIITMVSKPSFDPNNLKPVMDAANDGSDKNSTLLNRALDGRYPPGSTFKTITLASTLEYLPEAVNRTFSDNGKINFEDGSTLPNFNGNVYGQINLKKAFQVSSNVVFGELAMELGNEKLKTTSEAFGFNKRITGVGIEMSKSQFPTLETYEKGMIAQSGIGQSSILATPMQMALVASTVANNGAMMQPTLVSKVVDSEGHTVKTIDSKVLSQVMPAEDTEVIRDYMKNVIDNNLGRWPQFRGTNAGGKTGTAEYNNPDGTPAIPHGWFIGAAPMDDPQIAIAVIVENGESGSGDSAAIASQVIRAALQQ